ncbi:MAG: hypothetical protein AAF074_07195 [Pseudomonadota bacterium]
MTPARAETRTATPWARLCNLLCGLLCAAGLTPPAGAQSAADAPGGGQLEISVLLPEPLRGIDFTIDACPTYVMPSPNGRELIFLCRSQPFYTLQTVEGDVWYGHQRLRARDGVWQRSLNYAAPGPLRVVALSETVEEAAAAYAALDPEDRPADLPDAVQAVAMLTTIPPEPEPAAEPATEAAATETPATAATELPPETEAVEPPRSAALEPGALQPVPPLPRVGALAYTVFFPEAFSEIAVSVGRLEPAPSRYADQALVARRWTVAPDDRDRRARFHPAGLPACALEISPQSLSEGDEIVLSRLPCARREIVLPMEATLANPECDLTGERRYDCTVMLGQESIELAIDGWSPLAVALEGEGTVSPGIEGLRARLPLGADDPQIAQSATGGAGAACGGAAWSAYFEGFCGGGGACVGLPTGQALRLSDAGPDGLFLSPPLAEAGWAGRGEVPVSAAISFRAEVDGTERVEGPFEIPLGIGRLDIATDVVALNGDERYPLTLDLGSGSYQQGRRLQIFSDAACTRPLEGVSMALDFAGTIAPEVPACSFHQVLDDNRPRSRCEPVRLREADGRAVANPEIVRCSDKRLVVIVVENSSYAGAKGLQVEGAIADLTKRLHERGECRPIDLVRTNGAEREVVMTGEDLQLTGSFDTLWESVRFDFLNSGSNPFEDFNWIQRQWGRSLGGVVVIADTARPAPTSQIDAPATAIWLANGIFRWVLDAGGTGGCRDYQEILRMDNCETVGASFDSAALERIIMRGLDEIAQAE